MWLLKKIFSFVFLGSLVCSFVWMCEISYKLLEQACLTDYRNNSNDALPEWNVQEQGKDWPNDIKDEHANITQKAQNRQKAVHRKAIDKPSGTLKD